MRAQRLAPVTQLKPSGDGRTLEVRLAPWDTPATVDDGYGRYQERFKRGALVPTPGRVVAVYRDHGGPIIGRLGDTNDRADGLYGSLRIADTVDGRDALALLAEEVVAGVSVEFELDDADRADPGDDIVRTGPLPLTGVALVPYPAYQTAQVLSARSETPTMTTVEPEETEETEEETEEEIEEVETEEAETARRSLVLRGAKVAKVAKVRARPRFESYGAFVLDQAKRYAERGERADDFTRTVYRALADEITTDVPGLMHETWLSTIVGIINRGRVTVDAFGTSSLPDGEVIAWPQYVSGPTVGVQATQKTEVPSSKVIINKMTSDIVTYGGAQDISIQTILRSSPSYVDQLMQLFALKLGEAVNAAAVTKLLTNTTTPVQVPVAPVVDAATAHALLAAIASAAAQVMANGGTPDVFVVGPNLWALMATSTDGAGRPLLPASNPSNAMGSSTLSSPTGSWQGLTWVLDRTLTTPATVAGFVGDSAAFETYLSPVGNLSVDVPEKLGRDVGVYQFASFALFNPKQVVTLKGAIPPPFDDGESRSSKK